MRLHEFLSLVEDKDKLIDFLINKTLEFLFKRKFQFTERIEAFFNIMVKHYPPLL